MLRQFFRRLRIGGLIFITSAWLSLVLVSPRSAWASVLGNLAASMQPGTWAALTTNGFNNGAIMKPPAGGSILEYTDKGGQWNPIDSSVLVLGGSHPSGGPGGRGQGFVKYLESNNTWSLLVTPMEVGVDTNPAHEYHHATLVPSTGDFYHRSYYSPQVMTYNHASQKWSLCTPWTTGPVQVAGALEYFPDRDSLVFLDGDLGVSELSLASGNCTGTWVARASSIGGNWPPHLSGLFSYHNVSRYS